MVPGRGRGLVEGLAGAYPRAVYRAMGFDDGELSRPLIGVAISWSELCRGRQHLCILAGWVKEGVRQAGGRD